MGKLGDRLRVAAGAEADEPQPDIVDEPCCTVCGTWIEVDGIFEIFCYGCQANNGLHCFRPDGTPACPLHGALT